LNKRSAITQIANSVNDLAQMFRDLSALVVEQGTILDRIDYNIEATSHNVDAAVKELVGVREHFAHGSIKFDIPRRTTNKNLTETNSLCSFCA
jgi:syntaxin 16